MRFRGVEIARADIKSQIAAMQIKSQSQNKEIENENTRI